MTRANLEMDFQGRDTVVTVNENVTMWELLQTFIETNVHRIFAIDESRNLRVRSSPSQFPGPHLPV